MKPASALRLLLWAVLAFVLMGLGGACAQEARRLDLDQTRGDAELQKLRAESEALALALQGAIAELTPRLAASTKRLEELTPKSGEAAPKTDVAAKDLENEKQRHDRIDAHLRAARAM